MSHHLQFIDHNNAIVAEVPNATNIPADGTFVQFEDDSYVVVSSCQLFRRAAPRHPYNSGPIQIVVQPE